MANTKTPSPRKRPSSTADAAVPSDAVRRRAQTLVEQTIDFIPSGDFQLDGYSPDPLVEEILRDSEQLGVGASDLPAHLSRMCSAELLSPEQERAMFREMNYLKFQVHHRRMELDPDHATEEEVSEIEALLDQAQVIRDHLIKANMRLAFSVVKKYVTPMQSFDEILSDGICTLMQAVEKFDYDRGFRFSTYAYRSIARTAYRAVASAHKEEARVARDAEDWAFEQQEDQSPSAASEVMWARVRSAAAVMLDRLDRRERFIIRSRYALGAHRKVRSFQDLANKLGISKERARQLEMRAVQKLRTMATEYDPDELFGAAAV